MKMRRDEPRTGYGTKVRNPMRRNGVGYSRCCHCGMLYTKLGLSRHWDKCKVRAETPKGEPRP